MPAKRKSSLKPARSASVRTGSAAQAGKAAAAAGAGLEKSDVVSAVALRSIAPLPFKSTLSSKMVDDAIRQVMAKRSADMSASVRVAVPDLTGKPAAPKAARQRLARQAR